MLDKWNNMLDKWDQWKVPIIIVVFVLSMVFSINYLSNSSGEHAIDDTKTGSVAPKQCYLCHPSGKVGNKSIVDEEKEIYNYQKNSNITSSNVHLSKSLQPINLSNISKDDKRFIALIIESDRTVMNDIRFAINAANNSNYNNFEISGTTLKRDSQKYLNMTTGLSTSYSLKNLSEEYNQALEDFYNAGKYMESGSRNPLSKDIDISIDYIKYGAGHMKNVRDILRISGVNPTKTNITKNNNI